MLHMTTSKTSGEMSDWPNIISIRAYLSTQDLMQVSRPVPSPPAPLFPQLHSFALTLLYTRRSRNAQLEKLCRRSSPMPIFPPARRS